MADSPQDWKWNDSEVSLLRRLIHNTELIVAGGGGTGPWPPSTDAYQKGTKATVIGNQGPYTVTFAPALTGAPSNIELTYQMADDNGDVLTAVLVANTIAASGFTFWLSGVPTVVGAVKWQAQV